MGSNLLSEPVRKVIVAGDRDWDQPELILRVLRGLKHKYGPNMMILNNGLQGAEAMANLAAHQLQLHRHSYAPHYEDLGTAALSKAHQTMIDLNLGEIKVCLVFEERTRRDTRDLIRRCEAAGIPWQVFRKEVTVHV
jgi:hypothetical protein